MAPEGRKVSSRAMRHRLAVALVLLAAGCGGGEPAEPAPLGLDTVTLPADRAAVRALLESLPSEIRGLPRREGDPGERLLVRYGAGNATYLAARPLQGLSSDPDAGPADVFSEIVESETIGIEQEERSEDARVVYVFGTTVEEGRNSYVASWADPDGEWVFAVQAFTPEERAALIEAFVEAAPG